MPDQTQQPPVQTLRDGPVVAKLWQHEGKNGPFISVTLGRTYQDEQSGEYRESRSLSGSDVLKGHALLLESHREIGKWREYFKEQKRSQDPQAELPVQPDHAAAQVSPRSLAPDAAQSQTGLTTQRDEMLAGAKAPEPDPAPSQDITPEQ